ncbi:acetolactate decarboxylase [Herbiconiux sp. VKM Ac-1786]|uniref:acetolactate decarboxylase n=1 Tax=Herbiconiux sp. VKM Ac-1786 TaxID=2783824 RepID=UPI00188B53F8|nr:acetolactate decarboxylase [Herbiconiux sp. VKM Ac-1786]MBF4572461.1 acetolactate decarboxylase [Herbiconiux sp. VKM Ac-1786]
MSSSVDTQDDYAVYQTSTMAALLSGLYDGDVTIEQLLTHGDFGLGTFNHLDGEMVVLGGICYHLRDDGSVHIASPTDKTPFAAVMHFRSTQSFDVTVPTSLADLTTRIDHVTDGVNLPVAVRVDGTFAPLRTRTVGEQQKPYPPLTEAAAHEAISTLDETRGTVAGFRTPSFEAAISVAGYHLHYVDDSRSHGGHVLDLTLTGGRVSIAPISELRLVLPDTADYRAASIDLADLQRQEQQAEGSAGAGRSG